MNSDQENKRISAAQAQRIRERERVVKLLRHAFTRAEVEQARAALKTHFAAHPDEYKYDLDHGFGNTIRYLEEREEESRALGLSEEEHQEREQMIRRTGVVVNPVEEPDCVRRFERAREEVQQWLERHPTDPAALYRLEYLDREEALARQVLEMLRNEQIPAAA